MIHSSKYWDRCASVSYGSRWIVEGVFSAFKRMLGRCVMSRYILTQNRETLYRIIAYNCYRITRNYTVIIGWFLQGRITIYPYILDKNDNYINM